MLGQSTFVICILVLEPALQADDKPWGCGPLLPTFSCFASNSKYFFQNFCLNACTTKHCFTLCLVSKPGESYVPILLENVFPFFFLLESSLVWASSTTTASIGKGADTPPLSNVDVVGRIIDSQSALSIPLFLFKVNESVHIFCFLSALGFFFFLRGRGIGIDDDCKLKPRSSNKCKSASASASRNAYLEQMTLDNAISLQLFVIFKRTAHRGSFECTSKNKMHA